MNILIIQEHDTVFIEAGYLKTPLPLRTDQMLRREMHQMIHGKTVVAIADRSWERFNVVKSPGRIGMHGRRAMRKLVLLTGCSETQQKLLPKLKPSFWERFCCFFHDIFD